MINLQKNSIKSKLIWIQLFITFIVLLLFSIIIGYFRLRMYRNSAIHGLTSMAQLIGANSASALTFLDNDAAEEVLSSLRAELNIANAWIYDAGGNLFAQYSRKEYADFSFPRIENESIQSGGDFLTLSKKITVDDDVIGMVSLRMSTEENKRFIYQNILAGVIVLVVGMIIAYLLAVLTQRHITNPILSLVNTVQQVSKTGDYSIRVGKKSGDEIGTLYNGFDNMMEQINLRETERDIAYKSLGESEERFKTLVSNIPGATYRCAYDKEWSMEYISDEVEKISGYPAADFINSQIRSYASIIHPDDRKRVEERVDKAIEKKGPFEIEYRVVCEDQSIRWVYEKGQGAFDEEGNVLWLDGAIFDITERKRAEELTLLQQQQLIQADKMATLGILVSGVAHEINNPNNFMLLNSNNLADVWQDVKPMLDRHYDKNGDFMIAGMPYSEMKEDITMLISGISEGAERIKKIVQSLKDFARQDAGSMSQPVKVNSIIESSTIILSNLIKKTTDNFKVDFDESLPDVKGNAQQIEQVIINLVGNACQALGDKSKSITIATAFQKDTNQAVITVSDEGKGITEDDLKHIMDPFFTTKRDSGGTGLGLSISYNIIKDHGGDLKIESEQGKGTKAIVILPAVS